MGGAVTDSQRPGQDLDLVVIDEYTGKVLAQGKSKGGDIGDELEIYFDVPGKETQVIMPRVYVDTGTDLIGIQTHVGNTTPGLPLLMNSFTNVVADCSAPASIPGPSPTITKTATPTVVPSPTTTPTATITVTPTVTVTPAAHPYDINSDKKVNIFDYNILVDNFGKTGVNRADINGNNKVDIFDYNILVANFGKIL